MNVTRNSRLDAGKDRPHQVNPAIDTIRVILAVKNFAAIQGVCHIGLGVTATNTLKVLRRNGIHCEAWAVQTYKELRAKLSAEAHRPNVRPITHVIISAPSWIQPPDFKTLSFLYPDTEFVQLNHSGAAYLSIDKYGIRNIRDVADLELSVHNVRVAANNPRVQEAIAGFTGQPCLLLPNLYDTNSFLQPFAPAKLGGTLRIGSFGASRPWKNQLCAAQGAVMTARRLGTRLELYVNSKRPDGGERMIESRQELFDNLSGCKLIYVPWQPWPRFRDIQKDLHILFQPSFDETFNVVTADGIAEGIPSVVTPAIEWTPHNWWCEPENPTNIMQTAMGLLQSPTHAVEEGRTALKAFVNNGISLWLAYLGA